MNYVIKIRIQITDTISFYFQSISVSVLRWIYVFYSIFIRIFVKVHYYNMLRIHTYSNTGKIWRYLPQIHPDHSWSLAASSMRKFWKSARQQRIILRFSWTVHGRFAPRLRPSCEKKEGQSSLSDEWCRERKKGRNKSRCPRRWPRAMRKGQEASFGQTDRLNFQKIKLPVFFLAQMSRPNFNALSVAELALIRFASSST